MLNALLKKLYFMLVRLVVTVFLGLNVRHRQRLPNQGPVIIVSNHNSHLDTMVLMSLFPSSQLNHVRPIAAADYFLSTRGLAWFALKIIGIIPIKRQQKRALNVFSDVTEALQQQNIVILFPEGSRGQPEQRGTFKKGVWHLLRDCPDVPVIPIFLHGLGKALPRGEALFVPFICDVFIGEALAFDADKKVFMQSLQASMDALEQQGHFETWE